MKKPQGKNAHGRPGSRWDGNTFLCELSRSNSSDYGKDYNLGCDAVQCGRNLPTFQSKLLPYLYCPGVGSTMSLATFINFYKTDSATSEKTPPFVITVFLSPLEMALLC